MFNDEHLPIIRPLHPAAADATVRDIRDLLRQGTAVCLPAEEGRAFLLTADDLCLFDREDPDSAAAVLLADRKSLLSVVLPYSEAADGGFDSLAKLPASAGRPVVFRAEDGTFAGYAGMAEIAAFALRERERFASYFFTLAETATDAVTVVDRNGTVICWNNVAEETYGIAKKDILGRRIGEHFQPDALMVLKMLDEGRTIRNTYHRPRPGNHVLINASPVLDGEGRIIGGIATEQDITRLVRLNDELMTAHAPLFEEGARADDPFAFVKGKGPLIGNAIRLGRKVAGTDIPILLIGEPGVGKHQLAQVIHQAGPRAAGPFLTVHCGSIPAALLEAELFGYQGGAFSGEGEGSAGKLEQADQGTIYLSEIDRLPLDVQTKLVRFLQEQTVCRIGGTEPIPVRVRVIAGTDRDLGEMARRQEFRSDLYYALNVIPIALPALRERKEDIPALVQTFARQFALQYQKPIPQFAPEVLLSFANYDWPGNIHELMSVVERCLILNDEERITLSHLPPQLQKEQPSLEPGAPGQADRAIKWWKPRNTEEEEKALIRDALAHTDGNKSAAAKLLGISRGTLYNKIRELQLEL